MVAAHHHLRLRHLPAEVWPLWRLLYYAATGGFIAAMALFTMSLAGWYRGRVAAALGVYVLLGPLLYLAGGEQGGEQGDELVGRWWVLGLIPLGLSVAVFSFIAAWRQRTLGAVLIAITVALAAAAGVHDYLVALDSPWLLSLLPRWTGDRIFLLHHAANLLLVVMGLLLSTRLVGSLHAVEEANESLEARVLAREREIAANYAQINALQRDQAVHDERQRMVQDLHDGLGSQLFTSLLRAERGALDNAAAALTLRSAIDEMRGAIEALAPEDRDFRTAFGNFRFRWDQRLRDASLAPDWQVELPDELLVLSHDHALQLLRVAQEALTNVLKHAKATEVRVSLSQHAGGLALEVADNGKGAAGATQGGRGLANMRTRAARLGGVLSVELGAQGGRVSLTMPLPAA